MLRMLMENKANTTRVTLNMVINTLESAETNNAMEISIKLVGVINKLRKLFT